ncbi:MAG: sensor histidine kinase [Armatimonadota bacterium]
MEAISSVQTWLYDNLPVAVAIFDRDLVYCYANSTYAATQGQPAASLRGRPLGEIDSAWTQMLRRMIDRARDIRRPVDEYNVSLTYPRQPSIQRTWDVTAMALIVNDEVDGYVIYMLDVTDRQEARRSSASEKRLRSILDTAIDAILVIDEDGVILGVNPATSRIFGYATDELVGQPVTMIMPSPYKEEHGRFLERYLQTNLPHIIGTIREVQGRRKNGEVFPMELSVAESQEYGPERHFVGIIRDITDRKRLEEELKTAQARLTAIFNTVPLPLYVVEPDLRITLYNEAAREMYGDIITRGKLFDMTRLRPDTRAKIPVEEWPLIRALREGKPFTDHEQIVVFPDGHEVSVLVHAAPVVVGERAVAVVAVSQDLTQLKAADRAKDAFLALITHELRSPLAAIISWADLALDDHSLCGEAMQVIQRSAQAQRRIIDDLLDISRVIYGKLSLDKQPVDAWEVARRIAEEQRRTIEEKELALELQPPSEPLPVLADPVRLEQIVNNLLGNAIKFTPAGGRITVAGAREGNLARLSVSDTGVGIAPEQLPLIFERFQQIGRERISGGLGLGLALVKGLVEMHGGKATAESPGIGKGSTFTVWLPLREE